jgi:hypothetical protein
MKQPSTEQPPPPCWTQACEALAGDPGIAMVVRASDSGKTAWIGLHDLVNHALGLGNSHVNEGGEGNAEREVNLL